MQRNLSQKIKPENVSSLKYSEAGDGNENKVQQRQYKMEPKNWVMNELDLKLAGVNIDSKLIRKLKNYKNVDASFGE